MHVMHETVECMHRLLCIVHTICIDTSTNTYTVYMHVAFAMHFTMLFSTGYTAVYTYTQTLLHDGQSTV